MSGAEQHGLAVKRNARLSVFEDMVGDIAGLRRLVLSADQIREFRRLLCRIEGLGDSLAGPGDHRVGDIEDRLGRSIIAFERDDRSRRRDAVRKVEDVPYGCGTKRIDRLAEPPPMLSRSALAVPGAPAEYGGLGTVS